MTPHLILDRINVGSSNLLLPLANHVLIPQRLLPQEIKVSQCLNSWHSSSGLFNSYWSNSIGSSSNQCWNSSSSNRCEHSKRSNAFSWCS